MTPSNASTKDKVAADMMQRDVLTIRPQDTLRDALALMTENHVTGLPVMDQNSKCVGLITASDILNYEREHSGEAEAGAFSQYFDPETQLWESVQTSSFALEQFGHVRVEEVMVRDLISVERETPIKEVARKMQDAGEGILRHRQGVARAARGRDSAPQARRRRRGAPRRGRCGRGPECRGACRPHGCPP